MSNGTGFTKASVKQWFTGQPPTGSSANANLNVENVSIERSSVTIRLAHSIEPDAEYTERKISPETELTDLTFIVRSMLRTKLAGDRSDLEFDQIGSMDRIHHAVVDFQDGRNYYMALAMNGQHQFQKVAHLFLSSEVKQIPVYTVSTPREEVLLTHDSRPLVMGLARPKHYCYLPIGDNKFNTEVATFRRSNAIFNRYYGRCCFGDPSNLELVGVYVAVVNDREISNLNNVFFLEDMSARNSLYEPFNSDATFQALLVNVKAHITPLAMGKYAQPSLPGSIRLSCSGLVPSIKQDLDSQPISVYGIWMSKLNDAEISGLSLSVPIFDEVLPHWGPDRLCERLLLAVRKQYPQSECFTQALAGKWMLCLWVMPQGDTTNTLHSFHEGCLEQFLLATHLAKNDRRLYVEAHVVSKDQLPLVLAVAEVNNSEPSNSDSELSSLGSSSIASMMPGCDLVRRSLRITSPEPSTALQSLPPLGPNHMSGQPLIATTPKSCLVTITFRLLVDEGLTVSGRHANVDLGIRPEGLRAILRYHCQQFRASEFGTNFLRELKPHGRGWRMCSYLRFEDERDDYLHLDDHTPLRFCTLSDLFLSKKALKDSPSINIIVCIDSTPCPTSFDSAEHVLGHTLFNNHRIGTLSPHRSNRKPSGEEKAKHSSLIHPVLLRYMRSAPDQFDHKATHARAFQGLLLGSSSKLSTIMHRSITILPKYAHNPADKLPGVWRMRMHEEATDEKVQDGVPEWPDLTFLPYAIPPGAKAVTEKHVKGEVLKLAVRVVNMFRSSSSSSSFSLPLQVPADVLVDLRDGRDAIKALSTALKNGLAGFNAEYKNRNYEIRFWALPWKKAADEDLYAKGCGKAGRLYRWKTGPMRQFLDGEMWKDGERKVWLEAHLVGGEMKGQRATFILLNGKEMVGGDEGSEQGQGSDSLGGEKEDEEKASGVGGIRERTGDEVEEEE